MDRIEFGELRIGEQARQNLMHVCETNWASGGPKVKALEEKWSNLFGYRCIFFKVIGSRVNGSHRICCD